MLKLRRITQVFFLCLFIFLFFKATYPYQSFIPVDFFLQADPLVAIITIITTKKIIINSFIAAFIILLLTIFIGRFFCGWICPLGTIIDLSDRITKKVRKIKNSVKRNYRPYKYSILIAVLIAALFSIQLIWFFDPISLLTRSFTIAIYPLFSFFAEGLLNILVGIGLFEDQIFTFYESLRGTILPLEPLFYRQIIFVSIIFLTILLFGKVTRRFWCRYLCPLGALLSLFSNFRILRLKVDDKCIDCGRCYRDCKMDAINDDFRTNSQIECIECMNCVNICPTNAIKFKFNIKPEPVKPDLSRRQFIYSGFTGLLTLGLARTAFIDKNKAGSVLRPPGSLPEPEFLDRCLRCHECTKICSTIGKFLQPSFLESGWEGFWTPSGDPRHGYCERDCNLCSQVCPTGAIHPITLEQKKKLPIGTASFNKNLCIPWYRNEDCLVCEEHCPQSEKAIKFELKTVEKPDGTVAEVKFPYVKEDLCTGCGICVNKCPLVGEAGIFVTNARQQRWEDSI